MNFIGSFGDAVGLFPSRPTARPGRPLIRLSGPFAILLELGAEIAVGSIVAEFRFVSRGLD